MNPNSANGAPCEWFLMCDEPSTAVVAHPTVGDVEICQHHLDWLMEDMTEGENGTFWPNPTKMVPPMASA